MSANVCVYIRYNGYELSISRTPRTNYTFSEQVQWLTSLVSFGEVLASILNRRTGFSDSDILWLQFLETNICKWDTAASYPPLPDQHL